MQDTCTLVALFFHVSGDYDASRVLQSWLISFRLGPDDNNRTEPNPPEIA
jgi:hypothetical protein